MGNIHGDEPTGRQLLLALAEWLCQKHDSDPRAKRIVTDMHLFLVPTANPDGFTAKRRENSRLVDLNRDFPDPIRSRPGTNLSQVPHGTQPETAALMAFGQSRRFVASAALHEGALVANYPWCVQRLRRSPSATVPRGP